MVIDKVKHLVSEHLPTALKQKVLIKNNKILKLIPSNSATSI